MTDDERADLLSLCRLIENYLQQTQTQIVYYPARDNDEDFKFLIRKAIYFQEMIDKISDDLTKADHESATEQPD